jgi:hypothetical protein
LGKIKFSFFAHRRGEKNIEIFLLIESNINEIFSAFFL